MSVFTVAHLTFHEARRRKVLLSAVILGGLFLLVFGAGVYFININLVAQEARLPPSPFRAQTNAMGFNFLAMAGLYTVNFLLVMMSALLPVDTLSGEINSGAIQTLVVKPVPRASIVLGKWLGFAFIMLIYAMCMILGVILIVRVVAGVEVPNVGIGVPIMLLEALLLLTVSIAGGTRFSTLANGVLVFGMFGLAFIGGWVEQIGNLLGNQAAQNIGIISSLIMPSEALWRLASYYMQPPNMSALAMTPFSSGVVPSTLMLVWAGVYTAGALALALWSFAKRDL